MLANNKCSKKIIIILCLSLFVLPNIAWSEISIKKSIAAKIASCPELPKVTWWKTTRIKIVKYVDFKYRGNWGPYILKWETYKRKMEGILANDGTALVKSRNVSLHGEELAFHIKEIEQRLKVTKCLQRIFSGQLALRNLPKSAQMGKQKKTVIITYLCVIGEVPIPRLLRCNFSVLLKGYKIVMQNSSYLISAKKYIRGVHKKYYRKPGRLHRARQVLTLFI